MPGINSTAPTGERAIHFHTDDVEQAADLVSHVFHRHELPQARSKSFGVNLRATSSESISMGEVQYENNSTLYCPFISGYHINVPLNSRFVSRSRSRDQYCGSGAAAIYSDGDDATLSAPDSDDLQLFAMKLGQDYVHGVAEDLLGTPVVRPIRMVEGIQITRGAGKNWWAVVRTAFNAYKSPCDLNAPMRNPLNYAIAVGLLSLTENSISQALREPVPRCAPQPIHRAAEFIKDAISDSQGHLQAELTPADVARYVGVSLRALQRGFRDHLSTTPLEYIRRARLRQVHEALIAARPDVTTVAAIAHRWGFYHGGRFAREYREVYGVSPSDSLKQSKKLL